MPRKQFSSEQIITKLREAEVLLSDIYYYSIPFDQSPAQT